MNGNNLKLYKNFPFLFLFLALIGLPLNGQYTNPREAEKLLGQGPNSAPDRRSDEGEGPLSGLSFVRYSHRRHRRPAPAVLWIL